MIFKRRIVWSGVLLGMFVAFSVPPAEAEPGKATDCIGNSPSDEMVRVGPWCVDKYEASVWSEPDGTGTRYGFPGDNYPCSDTGDDCDNIFAVSRANTNPSRRITWFQAQRACANAGKQLLPNAIWQIAAAGTPDMGGDDRTTTCNLDIVIDVPTGSRSACVSKWGAYDMVGNVDEWVAEWMQDNEDRDDGGASTATYGNDRVHGVDEAFPETDRFPAALTRGGSGFTGGPGVFALDARYGPSYEVINIGFRCGRF